LVRDYHQLFKEGDMPPLATSLRHLFALVLENLNNKVGTASCEKNIDLIVLIFTQV